MIERDFKTFKNLLFNWEIMSVNMNIFGMSSDQEILLVYGTEDLKKSADPFFFERHESNDKNYDAHVFFEVFNGAFTQHKMGQRKNFWLSKLESAGKC